MAWKPDYATRQQLADYVRAAGGEPTDDTTFDLAVTSASRAVDRCAQRQFGKTTAAEARYYTAEWVRDEWRWEVVIDDVMTTSGLLVDYDGASDDTFSTSLSYTLLPRNAAQQGRPWEKLRLARGASVQGRSDAVRVTAVYGWTAVPSTVVQATLLQGSRIAARRNSPFGVAGSPDAGSELRLLERVDPDVEVALRDVKRRWWVS